MDDTCVYGIGSPYEEKRLHVLKQTLGHFQNHELVEAVFPKFDKVPWLNRVQQAALERCERELKLGEIGALLSHRRVWKRFLRSGYRKALVIESDAELVDGEMIRTACSHAERYDMLFLGSYNGRTKLKRSTSHDLGAGTGSACR
jgi:GR25 family glycosyltransferase involved in LPS biosynthesis